MVGTWMWWIKLLGWGYSVGVKKILNEWFWLKLKEERLSWMIQQGMWMWQCQERHMRLCFVYEVARKGWHDDE
jgi:hypothetical protein